MKVAAEPFTAERPIVPVGFAPTAEVMMQEPVESLKHPPESWMPFANVEEAEVPVTLRYVEVSPPESVVVEGDPKVAAPLAALNESAATEDVAVAVDVAR